MLLRFSLLSFVVIFFSACSSLVLSPAEFGWPVESVVRVQDDGTVFEDRYSITFNSKVLFFEETSDSNAYIEKELRLIRNDGGYYFITTSGFKNVYVFESSEGSMNLKSKIFISEFGLKKPYFNQRTPYIELVDGDKKLYLDNNGIAKEQ